MILTGRIFDIHKVTDKVSQIVVRKKVGDKIVPVAAKLYGYWNTKMLEMNLQPKQRIKGNIYVNSRLYNGKYYNEIYFKDVFFCADDETPVGENRMVTGRIFDIIHVDDKNVQVILKKRMGDKLEPFCISLFGYWRDKFVQMKLKPKDKIKGKIYLKSKFWETKYITDIYFKEITLIEEKLPPPIENSLFSQCTVIDGELVDKDTGEVIEEIIPEDNEG